MTDDKDIYYLVSLELFCMSGTFTLTSMHDLIFSSEQKKEEKDLEHQPDVEKQEKKSMVKQVFKKKNIFFMLFDSDSSTTS